MFGSSLWCQLVARDLLLNVLSQLLFRYADTLGALAYSSALVVRQDFVGGSYALLRPAPSPSPPLSSMPASASEAAAAAAAAASWIPLPDYWIALVWNTLVGQRVFGVDVSQPESSSLEARPAEGEASSASSSSSPAAAEEVLDALGVYAMCLRGNETSSSERRISAAVDEADDNCSEDIVVVVINRGSTSVDLDIAFTSTTIRRNYSCDQLVVSSTSLQSQDVSRNVFATYFSSYCLPFSDSLQRPGAAPPPPSFAVCTLHRCQNGANRGAERKFRRFQTCRRLMPAASFKREQAYSRRKLC